MFLVRSKFISGMFENSDPFLAVLEKNLEEVSGEISFLESRKKMAEDVLNLDKVHFRESFYHFSPILHLI